MLVKQSFVRFSEQSLTSPSGAGTSAPSSSEPRGAGLASPEAGCSPPSTAASSFSNLYYIDSNEKIADRLHLVSCEIEVSIKH